MKTRHCNQCGKNKPETLEYFYRRGDIKNGKFCSTCIDCKVQYAKNSVRANRNKRMDGQKRNNLEGFTFYMINRPVYFKMIFKVMPTVDNIKREYDKIKKHIDGPSILKELGGFGDVTIY